MHTVRTHEQYDDTIAGVSTVMLTAHAAAICDSSKTTALRLTRILSVEPSLKNASGHEHFSTGGKRTKSSAENVGVTGASEDFITTARTMY